MTIILPQTPLLLKENNPGVDMVFLSGNPPILQISQGTRMSVDWSPTWKWNSRGNQSTPHSKTNFYQI